MSGPSRHLPGEERGVTGIETAIVLIAFVVVASVFAFTMLNTGFLATEQTRETAIGGINEAAATLVLRGSVIALATTSPSASVQTIKFQINNASRGGSGINLTSTTPYATVITYLDSEQAVELTASNWSTAWLSGSGVMLDPGERVELTLDLTGLVSPLGARKEFTIEVRPSKGAVLTITRTTPAELTPVVDLQ